MSGGGGPHVITKVVYRTRSSAGVMSGLFGCLFAVLGIFTIGLLFLPFAVLFSLVSLLRSAVAGSSSGFCAAAASSILTIIGFVVSPTALLVLIGLIGLSISNSTHHPEAPQPPVASTPSNAYQSTPPPDNSGDQTAPPEADVPTPTPPLELNLSQPAKPQLSPLQGFEAGAADRAVMEAWFDGLSGSFKDGAEYWAANRSLRPKPTCESQEATQPPGFYQGCLAAKAQLDQVDARRLSDPEYRAGWNTPPS